MILYFAPQMPKYLVEPNIKVIACPSQWVTWEKLTKIFVFGTIAIVLQNLVVEFLGPKRMIIQLAQYLSKIRVYPEKLFPDVCHARWYEKKIGQNISFARKITFFYTSFCFQQPLRCYRIDLVTSQVIVRRLLDYNLPLSFVTLDNARKNRPKSFLHWARCFFSKVYVFNNLFPTEMILLLPQ